MESSSRRKNPPRTMRIVKGKWTTQGLVKWKGWDRASENTWKDLAEINDEELLAQTRACEERQNAEKRARETAFEEEIYREREKAAAARRGSGVDG
eukprot:157106-Pleurochrysis_carterae.AAC.1